MFVWHRENAKSAHLALVSEDDNGIASAKLARCQNCGREIYRARHSWAHLFTEIVLGEPLVHEHMRAEPAPD